MIQRLFQPFNSSRAFALSSLDHPSPLSSLHCLCLLTPSLSFALSSTPTKHHSPTLHNPSLLVQQLLITICFSSSPFCPAPLALSFHYCLVAPLTDTASAPTQPQLSLQSGSKTQVDLELCKEESSWFVFKWKEGVIQEHGILPTFSLKINKYIYIVAGFDKNFYKTSLSIRGIESVYSND